MNQVVSALLSPVILDLRYMSCESGRVVAVEEEISQRLMENVETQPMTFQIFRRSARCVKGLENNAFNYPKERREA